MEQKNVSTLERGIEKAVAEVIMTMGLLPPRHGVHENGRGALADEAVNLAEMLKGHRYATGASWWNC